MTDINLDGQRYTIDIDDTDRSVRVYKHPDTAYAIPQQIAMLTAEAAAVLTAAHTNTNTDVAAVDSAEPLTLGCACCPLRTNPTRRD